MVCPDGMFWLVLGGLAPWLVLWLLPCAGAWPVVWPAGGWVPAWFELAG